MEEYITIKTKVSTIKRWAKVRLFVLIPYSIVYVIFSLVVFKDLVLTILGVTLLGYLIWRHLHWRKLLKGATEAIGDVK